MKHTFSQTVLGQLKVSASVEMTEHGSFNCEDTQIISAAAASICFRSYYFNANLLRLLWTSAATDSKQHGSRSQQCRSCVLGLLFKDT